MTTLRPQTVRRRRPGGFTLVEAMFGTVIASLLMLGTADLYMNAARTTLKVNAQTSASQDASNSVQQIIQATREAQSFSLPNETPAAGGAFVPPPGFPAGTLQTTLGSETIYTALELVQPATLAATVQNTAGANVAIAPLNRDGAMGSALLFYRADPNGTPDANAGTCLWEYGVQANSTVTLNQAICKSLDANAPNAMQFVRPYVGTPAQPQPYDVEVKIISSYYSLVNGQQTNEQTNGSDTSQLSGKCVLMRDHANAVLSGGSNDSTNNNAFRFH